ncbi:TPA: hypothetical protein DDW35_01795, partial [Candidatus Sumerlaeota bacterium]|nr:hypothetical protein [Candidatus Sumerlaeota bacterium]
APHPQAILRADLASLEKSITRVNVGLFDIPLDNMWYFKYLSQARYSRLRGLQAGDTKGREHRKTHVLQTH